MRFIRNSIITYLVPSPEFLQVPSYPVPLVSSSFAPVLQLMSMEPVEDKQTYSCSNLFSLAHNKLDSFIMRLLHHPLVSDTDHFLGPFAGW